MTIKFVHDGDTSQFSVTVAPIQFKAMLYTYTHFVIHILLKVSKTDEILTKKHGILF
jgi:hypothetical protein